MEDNLLLENIERYLSNEMSAEEKAQFELIRTTTPVVDQMVVEHKLFLNQMDQYAETLALKQTLQNTHERLASRGEVYTGIEAPFKVKVVHLWHRYRKVTTIAASIAGFTTLLISGALTFLSPSSDQRIQQLGQDIEQLKRYQKTQAYKLSEVESKIPQDAVLKGGGSAFLISPKGYLFTNAHVVKGSKSIIVKNKGKIYNAIVIYTDNVKDIALLKIKDDDFKPLSALPYSFKKSSIDLGDEIYTLGFPKDEIVYNMGYLSARNGFEGDTLNYQISLSTNPGNSGGPVFNKNGDVIGVLSSRENNAEGMAFAIKSGNIISTIDELKEQDSSLQKIKIPTNNSSLRGISRAQQVKQIENCVFQVNAYN